MPYALICGEAAYSYLANPASQLPDQFELTSLSRVCRDMNSKVTPFIYSHTVVDISPHQNSFYSEYQDEKTSINVDRGLNLLRGLANNRHLQCGYVRKLTVRNGYSTANSCRDGRGSSATDGYFDF